MEHGNLGLIAFQVDKQQPFLRYELVHGRDYTEKTVARIDREVEQLLADRLVNILLREEIIYQETLAQVLRLRLEHLEEVDNVPVPA